MKNRKLSLSRRFRGFLPVVIDVETSGLNPATDALLEIAIVMLKMDSTGNMVADKTHHYHVDPFLGANIDPASLEITQIDIGHPFRFAIPEQQALHNIFRTIEAELALTHCQRAVFVGHNAWFDLAFIQAAVKRCLIERAPFHSFTSFDTATLAGVALGETVLVRAARAAGILFDVKEAHSAIYDAEKTAELFCYLVNKIGLI